MTVPETPAPKKNNTTLWIIIAAVVVVVICCALAAAALVGGYFYLRANNRGFKIPQQMPFLSTPHPVGPNTTPPATGGKLVVEPFDPSTNTYPTLPDLIPGWSGQTQPGSKNWPVIVPSNQPVIIMLGWCTTTPQILEQNDQQIKWSLKVDGQAVDVSKLFSYDEQLNRQVCHSYVGVIRQWPGTTHEIITTMTVAQKINDGFSDYAAGDYTDVYNVTVGP
jgi:hypothetical protein